MVTENTYDFIIVGAGPAGCVLASRLAASFPHFDILLIEAGGENVDPEHKRFGERHFTYASAPGYDWGYKTIPQDHLGGRQVNYNRGKGLGGSSAVNFCVYTRGPSSDYDQWGDMVGDQDWGWERVLKRFKKLESFTPPAKEYDGFIDISAKHHGYDGPLKVGVSHIWEEEFGHYFDGITKDYPLNLDHNSGNPIGMALSQYTVVEGRRVTASGTFLSSKPSNLTVQVESAVKKIIFEGLKVRGIVASGKRVLARKEVILSAGAIDSPKLLLLSGVGPKEDLAKLNIPLVQDLAGVGRNLQDHLWIQLATSQKPGTHHRTSYVSNPTFLEEARKQWMKDQTGPLAGYYLPQMMAYLRSDRVLGSKEFQELDEGTQKRYEAETKPNYELISHNPSGLVEAPETYLGTVVAFMGAESSGTVTLQSTDPKDPPIIDPQFLSHPFDRRVAIECVRDALDFLDQPFLAQDRERLVHGPKGLSDDEILDFASNTGLSMWHMSGTVKMGKPDDVEACVDKDCRVKGVQGLRVVDMSVAPFVPNAHTQAVAYVIGATAAEKMIAEYGGQA